MKRKFASIFATAAATVTSLSYGAMNAFAEEAANGSNGANKAANPLFTLVIPLVGMFAILYFMAIRPQKKKEQEMKSLLHIRDGFPKIILVNQMIPAYYSEEGIRIMSIRKFLLAEKWDF